MISVQRTAGKESLDPPPRGHLCGSRDPLARARTIMNLARPILILSLSSLALMPLSAAETAAQQAASHPGQVIFERQCASCHGGADPRAPAISAIRAMSAADLRHALDAGSMMAQAANLSSQERASVVEYLASPEVSHEDWIAMMMCSIDGRAVDMSKPVVMGNVGIGLSGTRMMSAELAGLSKPELENLELAWAIAFPGVTGLRSAPVIVGETMFYSAVSTRKVFALDTDSGCVRWVYDSPAPLRSSVTIAEIGGTGGRQALFFGDARGDMHSLDAETGRQLWVTNAQADKDLGMLTGSPVVHDDIVIVPVSASGVSAAANPNVECCVGRGAVVALDARTGDRKWVYFTMEEAQYTGEVNSAGARLRGPSGAPIWSTPTIDEKRRRVYVTTGQNTSLPATTTSNAIIALDLDSGEEIWVFQAIADDVWNLACGARSGPNCPSPEHSILRDWDFGSSAVIFTLPDGRDVLLAGQKSGHLWAVDAETGAVLWDQRVGGGGALGGNHWGIAIDGERVFLPINDPLPNGNQMPGMYAFDIATGAPVWEHRLTGDCSGGRDELIPNCRTQFGLSATPLVIDGAVVSAGIDGRVFIHDGVDGRVLFQYDTARRFTGINGVEGTGGAIDSHSIAAGAGKLFIASGYAFFSQPGGNVLLAFKPRQ
jgi:polyvinyl alcohol dehydrogenase (cytochrome)